MRVLDNKYKSEWPKKVKCDHCLSTLEVEETDLGLADAGRGRPVTCPCCQKQFRVLTEQEKDSAYWDGR